MLVRVPKPGKASLVFIDTSVLIDYLIGDINLPGYSGLLEKRIRELLLQFIMRGILPIRITPTVKFQAKSWRDKIALRAKETGVPPKLVVRIIGIAQKRYEKLSGKLKEETVPSTKYDEVKRFYINHGKKPEFLECRKRKEIPSPLPEESDMRILAEVSIFPKSYFLAADCDYFTLSDEIADEFGVYVISQDNMNAITREWGWF